MTFPGLLIFLPPKPLWNPPGVGWGNLFRWQPDPCLSEYVCGIWSRSDGRDEKMGGGGSDTYRQTDRQTKGRCSYYTCVKRQCPCLFQSFHLFSNHRLHIKKGPFWTTRTTTPAYHSHRRTCTHSPPLTAGLHYRLPVVFWEDLSSWNVCRTQSRQHSPSSSLVVVSSVQTFVWRWCMNASWTHRAKSADTIETAKRMMPLNQVIWPVALRSVRVWERNASSWWLTFLSSRTIGKCVK